jgi:stalled ribosome rescue protein Dom34
MVNMDESGSDIKGVQDYKLELAQKVRMTSDQKKDQSERDPLFSLPSEYPPVANYSSSTSF